MMPEAADPVYSAVLGIFMAFLFNCSRGRKGDMLHSNVLPWDI